jgi:uncharacterized membrane protein
MTDFWSRVRSSLVAGVLVLAPLGLTIWGLFFLVDITDSLLRILPKKIQPETLFGFPIPGLGIVLTLVLLLVFGTIARHYAGRRIIGWYESLLKRVPVISSVYLGLKQLFETLFSHKREHFSQAVVVEYPRKGVYCIAFVTNEKSALEGYSDLISIFLPTTPNPTSGFFLMVPKSDLRYLDISIEDAFKMIMSAGLVLPHAIPFRRLEETEKREGAEGIISDNQMIDQRDIEQ